jgi:hypothetical protein
VARSHNNNRDRPDRNHSGTDSTCGPINHHVHYPAMTYTDVFEFANSNNVSTSILTKAGVVQRQIYEYGMVKRGAKYVD